MADPLTELAFEIERFEWTGDDRLEVTGRWFGVRGLRFIRPTLHVRLGDRRRRLIALLDDKPWPADGEGPWIAAFSWRGPHDGVTAARLEVAPDVVIDLPAPGADAAGATLNPRPRPRPKPRSKPTAPPPKPPAPIADAPPAAADAPPAAAAEPPAAPAPEEPPAVAAEPAPEAPPAVAAPAPEERPAEAAPAADAPAAPTADAPPTSRAEAAPSAAAELATLALQRRLVEERAGRERLAAELDEARQQIAALSEHHEAAVERARELVKVEGELSAATARAERAEAERKAATRRAERIEGELDAAVKRAEAAEAAAARRSDTGDEVRRLEEELAIARAPIEVPPLSRRSGEPEPRRYGTGTRVAAVVLVALLLAALVLILGLI